MQPVVAERCASVLPTAPVEPSELLRCPGSLLRGNRRSPERTGAHPARAARRSALLAPLVAASTEAQLERLAPALRWLMDAPDPESGPLGWKERMLERAQPAPTDTEPASGLDIR